MAAMMFDTLALSRKLKAASFTPDQAEGLAEAINASAVDTLATKQDLSELKADLVRWIAGALVAQTAVTIGIVVALVKLIH